MKQAIVIISFLTMLNYCNGQSELNVIVFDSSAKQVLPFANIALTNYKKGNATDLSGIATIKLGDKSIRNDTIICSYIGFQTKKISIQLPIKDTLKINLTPSALFLSEVVVSENNKKLSGRELVVNAIKNIKENYKSETVKLETFYREKLYENSKLIELNESLNTIIYTKYPQKRYVKKSWRAYWDDNQKFEDEEGDILYIGTPQFFKYYNTIDDKCYIRTKRRSRNISEHKIYSFISGGPLALTAIDKVKYLSDFLDSKLLIKYDYYRKEAVLVDSTLCIAVGFKPRMTIKSVFQPWDKKIEFPLFSGTIYISTDDFAIVKFECQFARNNKTEFYQIKEPWQIFPTSISFEVIYQQTNSRKWLLHSVKTNQFIRANSSGKWTIPENYNCVRELTVTNIKSSLSTSDKTDDLLRDISGARLRSFPSRLNISAWEELEKIEIYKLTPKELKEIERDEKLLNQFKENEYGG